MPALPEVSSGMQGSLVALSRTCVQVGDGSNFVLVLAGALLEHAEDLLRMGLSPTEVIEGYETACKKAMEVLPSR